MSLSTHRARLVALLACLVPLTSTATAVASGSGTGNVSISSNPTAAGGPAGAAGPGAGGASGTSGAIGGGGNNGQAASGNTSTALAKLCTIGSVTNSFTASPVQPTQAAQGSTRVVIPSGCPLRSTFLVTYTDAATGALYESYRNNTGLATSNNANAVTPGTDTTVSFGFPWGSSYTVHVEIDDSAGQFLTAVPDSTLLIPAQPS